MIEEHVNFNSDGMKLEGVLSYDENAVNPPRCFCARPILISEVIWK
jgi:hypothetical protein